MTHQELRQTLSLNIKRQRKLLSLTQEKLAELSELSAQTINDIEGCRTWVSDKTLVKISEVLQTTPADLLLPQETIDKSKNINMVELKIELQNEINTKIDEIFRNKLI